MTTDSMPFRQNDIVEITTRNRDGEKTIRARVNWIERSASLPTRSGPRPGWYFGYTPQGPMQAAWGCASLMDEERPFGVISVRVIGHEEPIPRPRWYPKPGDRSYDLVH